MTVIITHLTLLHLCLLLLARLRGYIVNLCDLYSYSLIGTSGVQLTHSTSGLFHFLRVVVSSELKSCVGNILVKAAALRVNLNPQCMRDT
jgi:hypothetical protein